MSDVRYKQTGLNYVMLYQDDGPDGPGGQSCRRTNPWTILMIFYDREEMREFAEKMHTNGRRKPRLTQILDSRAYKGGVVHQFGEQLPLRI